MRELDKQGKLPVYVDGCFVIDAAWQVKEGLEELKRLKQAGRGVLLRRESELTELVS